MLSSNDRRFRQARREPVGPPAADRSQIFYPGDEFGDVRWSLSNHEAVLSKVTTQGIDRLCALPHQQITGTEHDRARLLLLTLHGHETHGRPLRRFADRLGIGSIVLLPLYEWLHIGRRIRRTVDPTSRSRAPNNEHRRRPPSPPGRVAAWRKTQGPGCDAPLAENNGPQASAPCA